jgi:hypothetical protein
MDGQNTGEYNNIDCADDFSKWFFDGKVFTLWWLEASAANWNSCLRPAGTLVRTAVSMTRTVYKELYLRSFFQTLQGNVHGK